MNHLGSPRLEARNLSRRYGSVQALQGACVKFHAGMVHAVVGENGAGKTTLMRLLAAEEQPDEGEVIIDGRPVRLSNPAEARRQGIAVVHQHFQLVDMLTVSENLFLGRCPSRWQWGPIAIPDRQAMRTQARQRLRPFGLEGREDDRICDLGVAERQMVEIAKALDDHARMVILDEPTASLSSEEAQRLFDIVRRMTAQGVCVILIAHSLEEVLSIADRITVMRSGEVITTVQREEVDRPQLVRLIVGHDLQVRERRESLRRVDQGLTVEGLLHGQDGTPLSLQIRRGEVVGMPTYIGSEVDKLLDLVMGASRHPRVRVTLGDRDLSTLSLAQRLRAGLCMVPGDTLKQGLVPSLSIEENLALPNVQKVSRAGVLFMRAMRKLALDMVASLGIRPAAPRRRVGQLSGGNRQKVVIGKCLAGRPKALLLDDPTKAVDVGAKQDIYRLVDEAAAQGTGVLFVSSDLDELLHVCDRILVVHQGLMQGHFEAGSCSKETLLDAVVRNRSAVSHPAWQLAS